jgi:hypothetical protein
MSGNGGICCRQSCTGAGFLRILRFPLPVQIPLNSPYPSIIRGWYSRPNSGRRTRWTQPHPTPRKYKKGCSSYMLTAITSLIPALTANQHQKCVHAQWGELPFRALGIRHRAGNMIVELYRLLVRASMKLQWAARPLRWRWYAYKPNFQCSSMHRAWAERFRTHGDRWSLAVGPPRADESMALLCLAMGRRK